MLDIESPSVSGVGLKEANKTVGIMVIMVMKIRVMKIKQYVFIPSHCMNNVRVTKCVQISIWLFEYDKQT